jgi:hypothetical protein
VGDVEELDGESEWLDEPLLNWKTRDCELVELSVLLRGVSLLFDLLLSKPKKPFRLLERCPLPVIAPGEFVSWPLALLVGLSAGPVLLCRLDAFVETDAFFLAKGPLSRSWAPGSPPKRGNSKEKLLLLLLLFSIELKPPASGGVRVTPVLFIESRLRYSRSSICSRCT